MDILLDTHVALWALDDSPRLSARARELILDGDNRIFVSDISTWEIAIKHALHPEKMPSGAERFIALCAEAGYVSLPLSSRAIIAYEKLDTSAAEGIHKDPFDRMLIAQSKTAKMLLLTHDRSLTLYAEPLVSIVSARRPSGNVCESEDTSAKSAFVFKASYAPLDELHPSERIEACRGKSLNLQKRTEL